MEVSLCLVIPTSKEPSEFVANLVEKTTVESVIVDKPLRTL